MDIFEKARDGSPVISRIVKFQSGYVYPFILAALCAISASFGKNVYVPCIFVLWLLTAFAGLFSSDLRVFIAPAFIAYYSLGSDKPADFYAGLYRSSEAPFRPVPPFDGSSLAFFLVCMFTLGALLIYKMIRLGVLKKMFTERGVFFYSVIAIDVAMILNGAGSLTWCIGSLLYGLLGAFVLTVCYLMFYSVIKQHKDGAAYLCTVLLATALCVCIQVAITSFRLYSNGILDEVFSRTNIYINRHLFSAVWGLVTIVGAVVACAIPAALYLTKNCRFPILCYVCALLFWAVTFFVNVRSAMIIGTASVLVGVICCAVGGKNKKTNRIITVLLVACFLLASVYLYESNPEYAREMLDKITTTLRINIDFEEDSLIDILDSRYVPWSDGIKDFLSAPVFGAGFVAGDYELNRVYDYMYHNVFIEFMGAMGSVGVLAFLFHIFELIREAFRKSGASKLLLLCVPLSILGMSVFDNFFFYPNFIIIYGAFLACAELCPKKRRAKVPEIK